MFSTLTYGLSVALVGMLTVFCALIILIGLVKGMEKVLGFLNGKKKISEPVTPVQAAPAAAAPVAAQASASNDELIAVITAAVYAMLEAEGSEGGFVVRSIRRVSNAPAWNRAGREEQVYSRM